jgi:hypothetical protein
MCNPYHLITSCYKRSGANSGANFCFPARENGTILSADLIGEGATMILAAIDPGTTGAIAFLDTDDPMVVETIDIPTYSLTKNNKRKHEVNISEMHSILAERQIGHCFIELQGSRPQQGITSAFNLGKSFGVALGIITAIGVPHTQVAPAHWKRVMQVSRDKDGCRARASELRPNCAQQWRLVKHHNRAEAALLVLFGHRLLTSIANGAGARAAPKKRPRVAEAGATETLASDDVGDLFAVGE